MRSEEQRGAEWHIRRLQQELDNAKQQVAHFHLTPPPNIFSTSSFIQTAIRSRAMSGLLKTIESTHTFYWHTIPC